MNIKNALHHKTVYIIQIFESMGPINIEKVQYVLNQREKPLCPFSEIGFAYVKSAKSKRGHRSPLLILNSRKKGNTRENNKKL